MFEQDGLGGVVAPAQAELHQQLDIAASGQAGTSRGSVLAKMTIQGSHCSFLENA